MKQAESTRSLHDIFAGVIFLVIAIAFGVEGSRYDFGSGIQAGPGFFPLVLSVMIGILGVLTIILGFRNRVADTPETVPWRAIILISASLVVFAAGARLLGLIPIVFLCTLMAAMASTRNSILSASLTALAMSLLCYLVFSVGLKISLPTFGSVFVR